VLNTIHEGDHKLFKKMVMDQHDGSAGVDGDKHFFAQYHFCPAIGIGHTFLEPNSPKLVVLRFTSQAIELDAPDELKSHIRRCLPWLPNDMSQVNAATSLGGHTWKTGMHTEWSVICMRALLSAITSQGYEIASANEFGGNQRAGPAQTFIFSERQVTIHAAEAQNLRSQIDEMQRRTLSSQADESARATASQNAELIQRAQERDALLAELKQEEATRAREVGSLSGELQELRGQLERKQQETQQQVVKCTIALAEKDQELKNLRAERDRWAQEAEEQHVGNIAKLEEQVAELVEEKTATQAQLALIQNLAPAVQEVDVCAGKSGERTAKHIRISCPGVDVDQINIETISNGVSVEIYKTDTNEGAEPIYRRDFQYHHRLGLFELDTELCTLENGILMLVLKCSPRPKLRLRRTDKAALTRIDENEDDQVVQPLGKPYCSAMSPSPSQDSLSTISSEWVVPSVSGDSLSDSAQQMWIDAESRDSSPNRTAGVQETSLSSMSSPASSLTRQCLLANALLLMEDGTSVAATKLWKGARLCSLQAEGDKLTFGSAVVKAIRVWPERDRDIVSYSFADIDGEESGGLHDMHLALTTSHRILACREVRQLEWIAVEAKDVSPESHRLFVIWVTNW
jgi:HSP20 family molecular chaperone IbpA